jgi:hypothetical protein
VSGLSLESVTANGLFFQGGNSPLKYFQDCLSVSMQYRRAAGYFSSSVFIASDIAMSGFIERGGKIQIVCSPRLMPQDIESFNSGIEAKEILSKSIERDISSLLENVATMSATKILGYLVSRGQLEIKISTKINVSPGKISTSCFSTSKSNPFCGISPATNILAILETPLQYFVLR